MVGEREQKIERPRLPQSTCSVGGAWALVAEPLWPGNGGSQAKHSPSPPLPHCGSRDRALWHVFLAGAASAQQPGIFGIC